MGRGGSSRRPIALCARRRRSDANRYGHDRGWPVRADLGFVVDLPDAGLVPQRQVRHLGPWALYGEGPVALEGATSKTDASFNEGKSKPFSADDLRFTAKGRTVFAFIMGWPASGKVSIAAMGSASAHMAGRIRRVELLGAKRALAFEQTAQGLQVTLPADIPALPYANALKIS